MGLPFAGTFDLNFTDPGNPGDDDARFGWASDAQGRDALEFHSVNQNYFTLICATTIGFLPNIDPTSCGQSIFNSPVNANTALLFPQDRVLGSQGAFYLPALLSNAIVGNPLANNLVQQGLAGGAPVPFVQLNSDPCDGFLADCVTPGPQQGLAFSLLGVTMNTAFTPAQQALFGCGQFTAPTASSTGSI
jgi:hypothetical protein